MRLDRQPLWGFVGEVLSRRSSGILVRLDSNQEGRLVFIPGALGLEVESGMRLSGFAVERGHTLYLVQGLAYWPSLEGTRGWLPGPKALARGLGVPEETLRKALACAKAWHSRGEIPPEGEEVLCKELWRELSRPYGELVGVGFPPEVARRIWEAWGPGALEYVAHDPYSLLRLGFAFSEVDRWAMDGGMDPDQPFRYVAFARHVLERYALHTGNTLASLMDLDRLLGSQVPLFQVGLSYGEERGEFLLWRNEVALRKAAEKEEAILRWFAHPKLPPPIRRSPRLPPEAQALLDLLGEGRSTMLLGAAGTGKTHIVRYLLEAVSGVLLLAPTGKAAARLQEATGKEAFTVHAALLDDRLLEGIRLVVVDEAGMVGVETLWLLIRALPEGLPLLLVGDPMQLPPVEPGHPLLDLMDRFPAVWLEGNRRSSDGILSLAQGIRLGSLSREEFAKHPEVHHMPLKEDLLLEVLAHLDPEGQVVLTPLRKGRWGTEALNAMAIKRLGEKEVPFPGMPLLFNRNNRFLGYANGETDRVIRWTREGVLLRNKGGLPPEALSDMEPAYAITVHRSQGSEWDEVFLLLPREGLSVMDRRWLYTAVTRARKRLHLLDEGGVFWEAYGKNPQRRRTFLQVLS